LVMVVRSLYPDGGDMAAAEFWTGLRPSTPDGPPVISATKYRHLWLNTGHGTLDWTMACGSARYLADLVDGRTPAIDPEGLDISRYDRPWPQPRGLRSSVRPAPRSTSTRCATTTPLRAAQAAAARSPWSSPLPTPT